jgi:hypothetical protein
MLCNPQLALEAFEFVILSFISLFIITIIPHIKTRKFLLVWDHLVCCRTFSIFVPHQLVVTSASPGLL